MFLIDLSSLNLSIGSFDLLDSICWDISSFNSFSFQKSSSSYFSSEGETCGSSFEGLSKLISFLWILTGVAWSSLWLFK